MKTILSTVLVSLLMVAGCAQPKASPPPLAPGYANSADQGMAETLATARAFYARLQSRAKTGDFKPSPAERVALNDLQVAINFAEPLYLAYHASPGNGSQAAAQQAVDNVSIKQATAQSQISAVK
jgi:hypothetical protein